MGKFSIVGNGRTIVGNSRTNVGANIRKKKIQYLKTSLAFVSGISSKDGLTIVLSYENEIVGNIPSAINFDVVYDGVTHNTPTLVSYSGNDVTLTLAVAPTNLEDVTVSYIEESLNNVGKLTDEPIINFVTVDFVSGANDVAGTTIILAYESDIVGDQPSISTFDIIYDGTAHQEPLTAIYAGANITLTVATAPTGLQVVTFSKTVEAGNNIGASVSAPITNNVV